MAVLAAGLWALLGRPEVAAAGSGATVPELVLGRGIAIGVRVGQPILDLRPLVGVHRVIGNGRDRRVVHLLGARTVERLDVGDIFRLQANSQSHKRIDDRRWIALRDMREPERVPDLVQSHAKQQLIGPGIRTVENEVAVKRIRVRRATTIVTRRVEASARDIACAIDICRRQSGYWRSCQLRSFRPHQRLGRN